MLVDISVGPPEDRARMIVGMAGQSTILARVDRGIYVGSINAANLWPEVIKDENPFDPWPPRTLDSDELRAWWAESVRRVEEDGWPHASCGVADSLEQVVKRYPVIETDPRSLVLIGSTVRRGENGGWRWHKWGPYIGDREPRCEYLDDEPEIDAVWLWHVYEVHAG